MIKHVRSVVVVFNVVVVNSGVVGVVGTVVDVSASLVVVSATVVVVVGLVVVVSAGDVVVSATVVVVVGVVVVVSAGVVVVSATVVVGFVCNAVFVVVVINSAATRATYNIILKIN